MYFQEINMASLLNNKNTGTSGIDIAEGKKQSIVANSMTPAMKQITAIDDATGSKDVGVGDLKDGAGNSVSFSYSNITKKKKMKIEKKKKKKLQIAKKVKSARDKGNSFDFKGHTQFVAYQKIIRNIGMRAFLIELFVSDSEDYINYFANLYKNNCQKSNPKNRFDDFWIPQWLLRRDATIKMKEHFERFRELKINVEVGVLVAQGKNAQVDREQMMKDAQEACELEKARQKESDAARQKEIERILNMNKSVLKLLENTQKELKDGQTKIQASQKNLNDLVKVSAEATNDKVVNIGKSVIDEIRKLKVDDDKMEQELNNRRISSEFKLKKKDVEMKKKDAEIEKLKLENLKKDCELIKKEAQVKVANMIATRTVVDANGSRDLSNSQDSANLVN